MQDGQLHVSATADKGLAAGSHVFLANLDDRVSVKPAPGDLGGLILGWQHEGDAVSCLDCALGQARFSSYLAVARIKIFWQAPEFGTSLASVPVETQFLLAELQPGGPYVVAVPMIDSDTFRFTIRPPSDADARETLVVRVDSGNANVRARSWEHGLLLAASWDPFQVVDDAVGLVATLAGGAPRAQKALPDSLNWFGWCTWDAFYHGVSASGVQDGLSAFQAGGCPPRFLIIDDGWQSTSTPDGSPASYPRHEALLHEDRLHRAAPPAALSAPGRLQNSSTAGAALDVNGETLQGYDSPHPHWNIPASLAPPPPTDAAAAAGALRHAVPHSMAIEHLEADPPCDTIEADAAETPRPATAGSASASLRRGGPPAPLLAPPTAGTVHPAASTLPPAAGTLPPAAGTLPPAAGTLPPAASRHTTASSSAPADILASVTTPDGPLGQPAARWQAVSAINEEWDKTPLALRPTLAAALCRIPSQHLQACIDEANTALAASHELQQFAAAAAGPLGQALVEHYVRCSVHANRLAAPACNLKFASPAAGPASGDSHRGADQFGAVVAGLKARYGLRYVYAWHALFGYWAGVGLRPDFGDSQALGVQAVAPRPTASMLELEPVLAWAHQVLAGFGLPVNAAALYSQMHSYLRAAGIDGVKVDAQSMVSLVGTGHRGGSALAAQFQAALEASIRRHFPGNHCINCMCHSSENMYRMKDTAVARVSDDFWPLDPASHTTHVAVCAFNTVYMGALVQPDWDMFHSRHPRALLHATARVASGGGVYVSDKPRHHDFQLLRRLVAPGGGLLRPLLPGRPTRDCLFADVMRDGRSLLKVWNHNPCSGLLAVFHLQGSTWSRPHRRFHTHDPQPPPLTTAVRPSDVERITQLAEALAAACPGVHATGSYAVYSDRTGSLAVLGGGPDASLQVALRPAESDMLTVAPILSCNGVVFAAAGLVNMLNAGGSIRTLRLLPCFTTPVDGAAAAASAAAAAASAMAVGASVASAAVGGAGPGAGAGGPRAQLEAEVHGTGFLLLHCSGAPRVCEVGGRAAAHRYDAERQELVVRVPATAERPRNWVVVVV